MKKLLIAFCVVIWSIVAIEVAHAETAKKPVAEKKAPAKKEVKKHKKFEGEKVPEKAPVPAKKADQKKK
jgi:hypothetical protein